MTIDLRMPDAAPEIDALSAIAQPSPVAELTREVFGQGWNARREFTQRAFEEFEAGEIDLAALRQMACEAN
ncbi:MAG: hypothetical protein NW215_10530 [Hyphomicrobiales bacterium]|nr:hypothetical protein [Hyphomicrobiales bacterium]